jgi:hypothetical protein
MVNWEHYPPAQPEKEEAMKCKFCDAELEIETEVCPVCGKAQNDVPEEVSTPKKKAKIWQIVLAVVAGLALLLSLTIAIYWSVIGVDSFDEGVQSIVNLFKPRENDVFYKDSYSVSDKNAVKKRNEVVATIGGHPLTNGQLQVCYWTNVLDFASNYSYYLAFYGLDITAPLDEQTRTDKGMTWQQYFLDDALNRWHGYQAMALMAEQQGMKLDADVQKQLDKMKDTLLSAALENGFSSVDEMIQADMGPGCTFEDFLYYQTVNYRAYQYFGSHYDAIEITDERLEAYFAAHAEELKKTGITKDSGNLYDVRHILLPVEGGTKDENGKTVYSESDWAACKEKAEKLLQQWLDGEHTETSFAKLAEQHSKDSGSNTNGGLYEDLDKNTNFKEEFVNWYLAEDRKVGDYGLIKTDYGYHIMYCSDIEAKWIDASRSGILSDGAAKILSDAMAQFPMEVSYKDIVLGVADLKS